MRIPQLSIGHRTLFTSLGLVLLAGCAVGATGEAPDDAIESVQDALIEGRGNMLRTATQPSNQDRNFTCPVAYDSADSRINGSPIAFKTSTAGMAADWDALTPLVTQYAPRDALKLSVILIRRINGVPHYFYLSNGTQRDPVQTWSSSKFMAFAAAASELRMESAGKVGISGDTVDTRGGMVPIGDLMSIATIYRTRVTPYTSNNLGTWMQNVSGRPHSDALIRNWIGHSGESFAGGYGEANSELGGTFRSPAGVTYTTRLSSSGGGPNQMSMLTTSEFLKRLVMHREDAATRMPNTQWEDLQTIFYGAAPEKTKYFADRDVGGMQGGPSIYTLLAAGGWNSNALEQRARGKFRHISKIGYGDDQGVYHSYNCFPEYNAAGTLVGGVEFVISAREQGTDIDGVLTKVVGAVTKDILSGRLAPRTLTPISASTIDAGDTCAPGCIYSATCATEPFKKFRTRSGGNVVCVRQGSCATECAVQ
jgi:hypothetical protein